MSWAHERIPHGKDPQTVYPQQKVAILREHLGEHFGLVLSLAVLAIPLKVDNFCDRFGPTVDGV